MEMIVSNDQVGIELVKFGQMLEDLNCDDRYILAQAHKILTMLGHRMRQMNQEYVLEQTPQLSLQIKKLKGTYNTYSVITTTFFSGGFTIVSGFLTLGAAVPGTALGKSMASAAPSFLGWLGHANWAKTLGTVGQGVGGVGQGVGAFSKLSNDSNDAERVFCNAMIEEIKRKRNDRQDAERNSREQCNAALNRWQQALQAAHQAAIQVLRDKT